MENVIRNAKVETDFEIIKCIFVNCRQRSLKHHKLNFPPNLLSRRPPPVAETESLQREETRRISTAKKGDYISDRKCAGFDSNELFSTSNSKGERIGVKDIGKDLQRENQRGTNFFKTLGKYSTFGGLFLLLFFPFIHRLSICKKKLNYRETLF